jgi:hypothetical protein
MAHTANAMIRVRWWGEKENGPLPSMRNLLDTSSAAQSLDGEPSGGEPAFPRAVKLVPQLFFRNSALPGIWGLAKPKQVAAVAAGNRFHLNV